jgi:hypothetical protein
MKRPINEVLKLTREADDSIFCRSQNGKDAITLPAEAAPALARYFEEGQDTAFIVGQFFAPAGSVKKSKLRIVAKALEHQRW